MKVISCCLAFALAVPGLRPSTPEFLQEEPAQKKPAQNRAASDRAVLITGASTGIGRSTAEYLSKNGFFVYAGARKKKDLEALDALDNVEAIRLDVTVQEDIDAAVQKVTEAGRGLYGLINNAGVLVMAPLTEVTEDDLAFQMEVNVMGPYRVTKAFADLLVESKGHVLTTGSISGFVTWGLGGPYTMSKHAVEAYTDCLAAEMEPLGVRVGVVEPGNFRSRIAVNMVDRMKAKGYTAEGSRYEGTLKRYLEGNVDRSEHKDPVDVAKAFHAALTATDPQRRYMVTPNQREAEMTIRSLFGRIAELNEGHEFSYESEDLHRMLEEALAR